MIIKSSIEPLQSTELCQNHFGISQDMNKHTNTQTIRKAGNCGRAETTGYTGMNKKC